MSNTIKLKRGSGSDPSASDLVLGELAIRTDNGKIFLKKDNGSVAEVSGGGITDGDKGDITVSNSGGTFTIDNNAVTFAKIQDIPQNRILGRVASGSGDATTLTAANVRTMINVEDGATADQTASEIVALIADQTIAPSEIDMEDNEKIKLGNSDDLQIYFDGSHSQIESSTGNLRILADGSGELVLTSKAGEEAIVCAQDGSVEIMHDNSKKFETTSSGIKVTGDASTGSIIQGDLRFKKAGEGTTRIQWRGDEGDILFTDNYKASFGTGADLSIFHDGSNSYISEQGTGGLILKSNNIDFTNAAQNEFMARFFEDSAVELYFNGTKRIETNASGSVTTGVHSVSNGILELKAAIATSHTITTDYNAIAVDPTINSGVTVTVPSGAVWAIV